jgi:hypothetical protein
MVTVTLDIAMDDIREELDWLSSDEVAILESILTRLSTSAYSDGWAAGYADALKLDDELEGSDF